MNSTNPPMQILLQIFDRFVPSERDMMTNQSFGKVNGSTDPGPGGSLMGAISASRVGGRRRGEDGKASNVRGGTVPIFRSIRDGGLRTDEETDSSGTTEGVLLNGDIGYPVTVGVGGDYVVVRVGGRSSSGRSSGGRRGRMTWVGWTGQHRSVKSGFLWKSELSLFWNMKFISMDGDRGNIRLCKSFTQRLHGNVRSLSSIDSE